MSESGQGSEKVRTDPIQTIDKRLRINTRIGVAQILDTVGVVLRPERIGQCRSDRLGGGQIPIGDETHVANGSHRARSGTIGSYRAGVRTVLKLTKSRGESRIPTAVEGGRQ